MKQRSEIKDITEIIFPRALNYQEVRDLCKYLALKLEGKVEVTLSTERYEIFGNCFSDKKPKKIEQLIEKIDNTSVKGFIKKRYPPKSADFYLERGFGEEDNEIYTRISFYVTPGYEPGELPAADDPQIMKETREIVGEYFSKESMPF